MRCHLPFSGEILDSPKRCIRIDRTPAPLPKITRIAMFLAASVVLLPGCDALSRNEACNDQLPCSSGEADSETLSSPHGILPAPDEGAGTPASPTPVIIPASSPSTPIENVQSANDHMRDLLQQSDLLRFMTQEEQWMFLDDVISGSLDAFYINILFPIPPTAGETSDFTYLERVCISLGEEESRCRQLYGY